MRQGLDSADFEEFLTILKSCARVPYMEKTLHFNLIFRPEPEGGFTVLVPSLPGCVSYGKNLEEAKKMAQDAIKGYIVSLKKHNEPIPSDRDNFISSVELKTSSGTRPSAYA